MFRLRNMIVTDVDKVAELIALDHDADREKGYREARQHTLEHLEIVPKHCYVVETDDGQIVAAMVLHPQDEVFEIEDFHVAQIQRNQQSLALLKTKLLEYLDAVQTEVLCCPYALRRLIVID